ncbi:MAG: YaiI/YqxD family protein [Chitinophagales bacterium]
MRILIDADACPKTVLQICEEVSRRYNMDLFTVASFNHQIESAHHIIVGNGSQETDIKVMNLTAPGDIVVTQDYGLAAMVIGKGAYALSPSGMEYRPDKMEFLLEERAVKAKVRRTGGRTRGPKKRTQEDDQRFKRKLEEMVVKYV